MQKEVSIKQQYSDFYLNYYQNRYQNYLDGEDSDGHVLAEFDLDVHKHPEVLSETPTSVRLAYKYFFNEVEGWTRLCKVVFGNDFSYTICVLTDGDDGWIEIYDDEGNLIASGRTYIELIGWGDFNEIRKFVTTLDYPSSLCDKQEKTLWK